MGRYEEWTSVLEQQLAKNLRRFPVALGIRACIAYEQIALFGKGHGRLLQVVVDWLEDRFYSDTLSANQKLNASDLLLAYCIFTADFERGSRLSKAVACLVDDDETSPLSRMWALKWLGRWMLSIGNNESALGFLNRALNMARLYNAHGQLVDIEEWRVFVLCLLDRQEQARLTVAAIVAETNVREPFITVMASQSLAFYQAWIGDFATAVEQVKTALVISKRLGSVLCVADSTMMLGIYRIGCGEIEAGIKTLRRARRIFAPTVICRANAVLDLAEAFGCLQSNNERAALRLIKRGLITARNPIQAGMLLWIRSWLPRLFAVYLANDVDIDSVHELIRRFKIDAPVRETESWPWHIKIQTFGEFRVVKDGVALDAQGRAHYKLIEFLKAIIVGGGRQVSSDVITEWLWPDAEGDAAKNNFKITLHRLRKLIGHDTITQYDGKISLNDRVCWVDTWAFTTCLTLTPETRLENLSQTRSAIAIYRGPFLAQDSYSWALAERERLRAMFQREASSVGKRLESLQAWDEATNLYRKCVELDPSMELLYRRLMLSLKASGHRHEAVDVYLRYQQSLRANLSMELSPETEAVYRDLLKN